MPPASSSLESDAARLTAPSVSLVIVNKGERAVEDTLRTADGLRGLAEIVVVDGSGGALADIGARHPTVRWMDYVAPPGVTTSIPHQRNAGVRAATGNIIVFTDAGCVPQGDWLDRILAPILGREEEVTAGPAHSSSIYDASEGGLYVDECATINLAFLRSVFDEVGGFDERFEYGSDVDFSWRIRDAGHRIRWVDDAVVDHDWGPPRRQIQRSYAYGIARARLYRKHRARRASILRKDPLVLVYPLFLLGLPIALLFPPYLLLLAVPLVRARRSDRPQLVLADHLVFGLGVLAELSGLHARRIRAR